MKAMELKEKPHALRSAGRIGILLSMHQTKSRQSSWAICGIGSNANYLSDIVGYGRKAPLVFMEPWVFPPLRYLVSHGGSA